jgi:hypothetical protein
MLGLMGCTGASAAEQRAQACFQHLSQGRMAETMECVAPDRRERITRGMEQRAQQMKGCHEQVKEAKTRRENDERAEVRLSFKQPCGEPPSDANGRQVTGIGVGLIKEGGKLWIVEFERLMD